MRLSKSNFIAWRGCGHDAWYRANKRELYEEEAYSVDSEARKNQGQDIDEIVRELYPQGVLLGRGSAHGTAESIKNKTPVLFQAEFITEKFIVICDILEWDSKAKRYDLIEVKSSTNGNRKDDEEYAYDIGFQAAVLQECRVPLGKLRITRLNSDYVRDGAVDLNKLFAKSDFTDEVRKIANDLPAMMQQAHSDLNRKSPLPGRCACIYEGRSNHCVMFAHINPDVPEYGVHDISRIGLSKKKLRTLVEAGILDVASVPDDMELSVRQRNQIRLEQTQQEEINLEGIQTFLADLSFPLSFLDFETFNPAVPRFDGYRPYTNLVFQFSVHVITDATGKMVHNEFLHTEITDPDEPFVEALKKYVPKEGSILVWNKSFEISRLRDIASRKPLSRGYIEGLITRIVDLRDVFSEQYYLHPGFRGSESLKPVLKVISPRYDHGKLSVQEGATASILWDDLIMGRLSKKEIQETKRDLLEYCERDTFAMVEIWRHLCSVVDVMRL